jgi:hypothetical protein
MSYCRRKWLNPSVKGEFTDKMVVQQITRRELSGSNQDTKGNSQIKAGPLFF